MHTHPEMAFGNNGTQKRTALNQEGRKPFAPLFPSRLPLAQTERPFDVTVSSTPLLIFLTVTEQALAQEPSRDQCLV